MGFSKHRSVSLVDQKRLQWAKEKAELARIGEQFSSPVQNEKSCIRTFFSNMDISGRSFDSLGTEEKKGSWDQHNEAIRNEKNAGTYSRVRSPSLPAIERYQRNYQVPDHEEETSGYSSEYQQSVHQSRNSEASPPSKDYPVKSKYYELKNHASERKSQRQCNAYPVTSTSKVAIQGQQPDLFEHGHKLPGDACVDNGHDTDFSIPNYDTSSNSSSGVSRDVDSYATYKVAKEGRAKWSDRTSNDFYDRMSERDSMKSGPTWLQRCGSEFSEDHESMRSGSHIRGQNAPIDPNILAERFSKRQKATEFQNAIRQQLQEREEKRQREREQMAEEERREEERLHRQRQMEKLRLEQEQRQQHDKLESERRKHELMLQAIEKAEYEAKLEKSKKKKQHVRQTTANDIVPSHADMEDELELIIPKQINLKIEGGTTQMPDFQSITVLNNERNQSTENLRNNENGKVTSSATSFATHHAYSHKQNNKTHNPQESPTLAPDNDKDSPNMEHGLALVLQAMPSILPTMPLTNEVLNRLGNVPYLAVLSHQLQQQQQEQFPNHQLALQHNYAVVPTKKNNSCEIDDRLVGHWEHKDQLPKYGSERTERPKQNVCQNCERQLKMMSSENEIVLHDGEFDEVQPRRASIQQAPFDEDCVLNNQTFNSSNDNNQQKPNIRQRSLSTDVATQTDGEFESSQNHHQRHYQSYLKEVTKMVMSIAEKLKKEVESTDDEKSHSLTTTCTTTTTTTTVQTSKSKKEGKVDDRPKWGVNRPLVQYKKASDRDPFYVRNKTKIRQRRYQTSCQDLTRYDDEQSTDCKNKTDSEDDVTSNGSGGGKMQVVPIKTDSNGKIFLNYREASFVIDKGGNRQPSGNQNQKSRKDSILAKIESRRSSGKVFGAAVSRNAESCYDLNLL